MNLRLERTAVHFGEVEYAPGGRCGPRRQQDYQLLILHSGELVLKLDRKTIEMGPGQAMLLHPGHREDFHFSRTSSTRHAWCSVKPAAVPSRLRRALVHTLSPRRWTPSLQRLFDLGKGTPMAAAGNTLEFERCLYLALHLLAEFAQEAEQQKKPAVDQRLIKLQEFIASSYARPLRLVDLARAAGVSRQHLLRLCRRREVPSPLEQLYRHRLETAADLLVHTGLSIKEISEQCGFENPFHFSRKFRHFSGTAPRNYRPRTG